MCAIITEYCPFCQKELEADSEQLYWHIKIHEATREATTQNEGIEIKPNKYLPEDLLNKIYGNQSACMHDNCSGCKSGTCSGVHMVSCPCPKCSPTLKNKT